MLDDQEFSGDEAEIPAGVTDSMLPPPDFVDGSERWHILNGAPGHSQSRHGLETRRTSKRL